jgi:hypothetical protein
VRLFAWHERGKYLNPNGANGEEIDTTAEPVEKNFKLKVSE